MLMRAYLQASTAEQDAHRAHARLDAFAKEHGQSIAALYVEDGSGAKLTGPAPIRLLADGHPGDVLLTEQVDRLSQLTASVCINRRTMQRNVLEDAVLDALRTRSMPPKAYAASVRGLMADWNAAQKGRAVAQGAAGRAESSRQDDRQSGGPRGRQRRLGGDHGS